MDTLARLPPELEAEPAIDLEFRLDDSLQAERGRILVSGTQALLRAALMQSRLDRARGWNTAGFVSGYRGSPLGGVDLALWKAQALLDAQRVRFMPAINEELAAAAALGTQRVSCDAEREVDGVFALWYGKGPGLDRAGDTMRHGNAFGASARGGVLAVVGDDHGCVSSGMPFQSDVALRAWSMPVLHPANVAELVSFALYGWALSRFSGAWVGMKALSETVEATMSVDLDALPTAFDAPVAFDAPPGGLHYRLNDLPGLGIEQRLSAKLDAVRAFAAANPIDRLVVDAPRATLGIVTCGKAHLDLMEALRRLELPLSALERAGVRLYKVGLVFPLEPGRIRAFADGLDELLVVEEKGPIVEEQIRALLYNAPPGRRPRVLGKSDADGRPLLPALGETRPSRVMPVLAEWLARHRPELDRRARVPTFVATTPLANDADGVRRTPYFCAGCPHNLSTHVPAGSQASGGIGCHGMSGWMNRSNTFAQVPMGSEGIDWVGQSFFTRLPHRFQNMGDGTYSHSGYLAIRQAVSSGANVTYKILYNDAVAMTGGQPVDRRLTVPEIARQLEAEGVRPIAVVTEDGERWRAQAAQFPPGTRFHARGELDAVQRELREAPGVSALLYDQVCATEKRRRIKRGQMQARTRRVFIHPDLCENCGDCTALSNCVAIKPVATDWGRKRQIDPTVCNQDYACVGAHCPAIVSLEGATLRRKVGVPSARAGLQAALERLPGPPPWHWTGPYDLVITGVGGTGIITVGALVATAAHLEGRCASVLDFMGFAQKGGSVIAFVRIAERAELLNQMRIDTQQADAMIAGDLVVGASAEALQSLTRGRTKVVANLNEIPTAAFVGNPDADLHAQGLLAKIRHAIGRDDAVRSCDAQQLAERLLGDTLTANVLLLGFAWQHGLVPLSRAALERALELNGVDIEANRLAFGAGRLAAADPGLLATLLGAPEPRETLHERSLESLIELACARLHAYQGDALVRRYLGFVEEVRRKESAVVAAGTPLELTRQVALNYARLLAVKDEYEVARLLADGSLERALAGPFEGPIRLRYHLAAEYLVRHRPDGRAVAKFEAGAWLKPVLKGLAALRGLRGRALDPFGWSPVRRAERALAGEYRARIESLLAGLTPARLATAVRIAALPESVRGFGHVKLAAAERARAEARALLSALDTAADRAPATAQEA